MHSLYPTVNRTYNNVRPQYGTIFEALVRTNILGLAQNYYEFANDIFRSFIGNSAEAIESYNYCCGYILGTYHDFTGRFTEDFITKFIEIVNSNQNEVIINILERHLDFFTNILYPVILNMNDNIMQEKKIIAVQILQKYIAPTNTEIAHTCTICIECINNSRHVVFPCNHVHHYDCIIEWFYNKHDCPNCRCTIE